jgi:hypothetical protein
MMIVYTQSLVLCVKPGSSNHNMFDDPGFTQSTNHCVYTIIIISFKTPVLHKVPVTVYTIIIICLMTPVLHKVPLTVIMITVYTVTGTLCKTGVFKDIMIIVYTQ